MKFILLVTKALFSYEYHSQSVINSFQIQQSQRNEIKQLVSQIPIAFSPEDNAKMTNEFMLKLAKEYM